MQSKYSIRLRIAGRNIPQGWCSYSLKENFCRFDTYERGSGLCSVRFCCVYLNLNFSEHLLFQDIMKGVFAILLMIAFVYQSTHGLWILASFYIQRDFIARNICVNRFDPATMCNGKCYLKKQLKETEQKDDKVPDTKPRECQLFCQMDFTWKQSRPSSSRNTMIRHHSSNFPSSDFLFTIFHPRDWSSSSGSFQTYYSLMLSRCTSLSFGFEFTAFVSFVPDMMYSAFGES